MKKIKLIILLSLINLSFMMAQDYQTVKSDRIAYFNNQYGNVKCIRIDSVNYQNDSILFPFSNIQQIDYDCFTPYGASWIGDKLIIQNNGYNIFFNKELDTIKIKTNALLNESWTAYELADSTRIIATVLKYDTLGFIGQLDSAKTIGFQVYDKTMTPISNKLNNMSVILSKNFGLVKTFNFNLFPDYETDHSLYEQLEEYDLIGLSKPQIGIQNLTWFDVHDFQIGDEIHVLYQSGRWAEGYDYAQSKKTIFKYLERTDYADSIIYRLELKRSIQKTWPDSSAFEYFHDTINSVIKPNALFEKLPGEPIISEYEAYSYSMTNGTNLSKTEPSDHGKFYHSFDSCWSYIDVYGCFPSYNYIKGLGGPYYQCITASVFGNVKNELVYYKKGQVTWGTPLIITEISNNNYEVNIELFPNPAKENIWIKTQTSNLPFTFELIDLNGQTLMIKEIKDGLSSVNVDKLPSGIYLYRLRNKNGTTKFGKLIIE